MYAHDNVKGCVEVGNRTCDYRARIMLKPAKQAKVELIEVDLLQFQVKIFDETEGHWVGGYDDAEAPSSEVVYWSKRCEVDIKRHLAHRTEHDYEWASDLMPDRLEDV